MDEKEEIKKTEENVEKIDNKWQEKNDTKEQEAIDNSEDNIKKFDGKKESKKENENSIIDKSKSEEKPNNNEPTKENNIEEVINEKNNEVSKDTLSNNKKEKKIEEPLKSEQINDKSTELIKSEEIEIDETKLRKINEEIKANKKKSKNNEVKNEKYLRILRNIVIAVIGIAYITIALMGAKRIPSEQYQLDLKVYIILSVISGVLLFEKAFKTDKFRYALVGIEILVMGSMSIILLHLYKNQNPEILKYAQYYIIVWILYYIIKNIIIAVKRTDESKKETENN